MNDKEIEQKILKIFKEIDNLKIVLKTTNEKIDFLTKPKLKKSGRPKKYSNPADAYEAHLNRMKQTQKKQKEAYDKQKILKEIEKQEQTNEKVESKPWIRLNDSEF
jgi:hypothetical protein